MKTLRICAVVCFVLLSSCQKEEEPESEVERVERDYAVVETENPQWPIMANHANGEHLAIKVDEGSNEIRGVVYLYEELEVYLELTPEGIPISGIVNDHLLIFENYEGNQIDLGIITPEGETHIFRELEIDETALRASSAGSFKAPGNQDLLNALRGGSLGVGIMGCALTAAATGPFAIGVGILGCGSILVSTIATIHDLDPVLETGATDFGVYANALGCPVGLPACVGLILDVTIDTLEDYQEQQDNLSSEYNITQAALFYGHGAIQITLTWENTADLDLHVTDPTGETISYMNSTSSSGGHLDVDDVDGYGPENVFWPVGTVLSGSYVVEVDHFSGASPANFTVRVQVFDDTEIYTGSISTDQTLMISSFTRSQISMENDIKITKSRLPENKKLLK